MSRQLIVCHPLLFQNKSLKYPLMKDEGGKIQATYQVWIKQDKNFSSSIHIHTYFPI